MTPGPIRIFVGADRSQQLAIPVLEHSIRRRTDRDVVVQSLVGVELPEPQDVRQSARTLFSFARFAIPEMVGYQGRAIYLDADMQVFRDIGELWDIPYDGASIVIQQELPDDKAAPVKAGAPKRRIKQCSVMLIDCARARWDVREIVAGLDGRYTYEDLMFEMCILPEHEIRYSVPFTWNSLEHFDAETRLIHYTDMDTQPWVSPANRNGPIWLSEVRLMLANGALRMSDIEQEIALGYVRPSLLREIDEAPHDGGWNDAAANRYIEFDRRAGFVKHAEVHQRRRQRAEAVKRYEASRGLRRG